MRYLRARSRLGGSGPLSHFRSSQGVSLPEALAVLTIGSSLLLLVAPSLLHLKASVSVRSAAAQATAGFCLARAYAISRARYVGLKFRKNGDRYEWALYTDGNGNGLRNAEIAAGIDRPLGVAFLWTRNDVLPGILRGARVPDPGQPGRFLDRLDDPIRFNNSDICSFSPLGESTPGSVYLWDGHDRMGVVRVYGRTAKIRMLFYRRGERGWRK